jgi:hypothetical protein
MFPSNIQYIGFVKPVLLHTGRGISIITTIQLYLMHLAYDSIQTCFYWPQQGFQGVVREETKYVYATTQNMCIMCNIIQYVCFLFCRIHEIYVQTVGLMYVFMYLCMHVPSQIHILLYC